MKFDRRIMGKIQKGLARQAVVAIVGPRQVGKTTLAREIKTDKDILYFDLENSTDRLKLSSPTEFFNQQPDKLVILDEIHKAQYLLPELRGIIDEGRRVSKGTGRFLILGSATFDVYKASGESLAGRIEFVELNPLNILEVFSGTGDKSESQQNKLWIRGGYPDSFLANSEDDSYDYRRNFIKTHLVRDMVQFKSDIPSGTLERFWEMLAQANGTQLDTSKFGKIFSASDQVIVEYVDFLSDIFLIRKLHPYTSNPRKKLAKSPRVYIRDSGLLHTLLKVASLDELTDHPACGNSWEGFVIENLLSVSPKRTQASYYREDSRVEIDLVLEMPDINETWAVEIKKTNKIPKLSRGFHLACNEINPDRKFLVYSGTEMYQISGEVTVLNVGNLANLLLELSEKQTK